ncbi:hypothetical protein RAC92_08680 [Agrobacterium sp. CR_3]|uniref:hypothetical protein n=1 Tax=Agrobacterium TaxID=357 RepID=UPI002788046C|nr:hypothetical protein [Agrobacterium tumefaciens]MDP9857519.1 hypothetical protein [Agrobacterium tumefaciens]
MDGTAGDRSSIQPLSQFNGEMKEHEWTSLPTLDSPKSECGDAGTKWVFFETIFQQMPQVIKDAPPLPAEEARYAQIQAVLVAAGRDPMLME